MFGKERRLKKKMMFLLQMDCNEHPWDIPEDTLWLNFNEALRAALDAVHPLSKDIDWNEFDIEPGISAFLPECFEILPISISTPQRITWLGREVKERKHEPKKIC